jgi:hypothetical protein
MIIESIKSFLLSLNAYGTGLTAIITFVYAVITWFILRENIKAYNAQYAPIVTLRYDGGAHQFIAENIGPGIAIDIEIGEFKLFVEDRDIVLNLVFSKISNLKTGQSEPIPYKESINKTNIEPGLLAAQLSKYGSGDNLFILTVRDILGNIYYEKINMGKSGVYIIKMFKPNWLVRCYFDLMAKLDEYRKIIYVKYTRRVKRKVKQISHNEKR